MRADRTHGLDGCTATRVVRCRGRAVLVLGAACGLSALPAGCADEPASEVQPARAPVAGEVTGATHRSRPTEAAPVQRPERVRDAPLHVWTRPGRDPSAVFWEPDGARVEGWTFSVAEDWLRLSHGPMGRISTSRVRETEDGWVEWLVTYGSWDGELAVDPELVGRWRTGGGVLTGSEMRLEPDGRVVEVGSGYEAQWGCTRDVLVIATKIDPGGSQLFDTRRATVIGRGADGRRTLTGFRRVPAGD